MKHLLAIPALAIGLGGCMTTEPGQPSMADRIIAAVIEGCQIQPAVQAVTDIVTQVIDLGDTAEELITLADITAEAICNAFRTDRTPEVAGVPLTGTVVTP